MKVLLAEDSPSVLMSTKAVIEAAGHQVTSARTGAEALDAFRNERPDLIILDIEMPEQNGYEVARAVRASLADHWIPIIFLSGMNECDAIARGIEVGGGDYLTKPVSTTVLNAKLRAMQRLADMRDQLMTVSRELAAANRELEALTYRDGLTGIANRRYFEEALAREWARARRLGSPIALIMADVDHFKPYNDNYGHAKGDECLTRVALALQGSVQRPTDVVARYGGEEFAVILPDTDEDGAMHVAAGLTLGVWRLRLAHAHSSAADRVTLSAGCASRIPRDGEDVHRLIAAADQALYEAKHSGRNQAFRASGLEQAA